MQSITCSVFGAILFFLLVPGLFIRFPNNGSKMTVAMVHALVFGILYYFLHKPIYMMVRNMEGMTEGNASPQPAQPKPSPKH